jgi:hypothetical protein
MSTEDESIKRIKQEKLYFYLAVKPPLKTNENLVLVRASFVLRVENGR